MDPSKYLEDLNKNLIWLNSFKEKNNVDNNRNNSVSSVVLSNQFQSLVHQTIDTKETNSILIKELFVANSPKNIDELLRNLHLVLNNFPYFQLDNHLAVYPYNKIPPGTRIKFIGQNLKEKVERFTKNATEAQAKEVQEMAKEIFHLLKPTKAVHLIFIMETMLNGDSTNVMFLNIKHHLLAKSLVIINKNLYLFHFQKIKQLGTFFTIYSQKEGSLVVICPKNIDLDECGFNSDYFEKSNRWNTEAYIFKEDIQADIKKILKDDNEEKGFHRFIAMIGHGGLDEISNRIVGMPINQFQDCLDILQQKKMAFLCLRSCFAGGTMSHQIHQKNGAIPCPIYIESPTNVPSNTGNNETDHFSSLLCQAEEEIFHREYRKIGLYIKKHLTEQSMQKIAEKAPIISNSIFQNLGMFLIYGSGKNETKKIVVPDTPFTFNLDTKLHKSFYNSPKKDLPTFIDFSLLKKAYVLNSFVIPAKIIRKSPLPFGFISLSDTSHHLIAEMEVSFELEIEVVSEEDVAFEYLKQIGLCTFNMFVQENNGQIFLEPSTKVFAIGLLRCNHKNTIVDIEQVVIQNFSVERRIYFRLKNSKKFNVIRFYPAKTKWEWDGMVLTINQGPKEILSIFTHSEPSVLREKQSSFKRITNDDFYTHLFPLFWRSFFAIEEYIIDLQIEKIKCESDIEKKIQWGRCVYENCEKIGKTEKIGEIYKFTLNALMEAIENRDLESVKTLAETKLVAEKDIKEKLALHFALEKRNFDIFCILYEKIQNKLNIYEKISLFKNSFKPEYKKIIEYCLNYENKRIFTKFLFLSAYEKNPEISILILEHPSFELNHLDVQEIVKSNNFNEKIAVALLKNESWFNKENKDYIEILLYIAEYVSKEDLSNLLKKFLPINQNLFKKWLEISIETKTKQAISIILEIDPLNVEYNHLELCLLHGDSEIAAMIIDVLPIESLRGENGLIALNMAFQVNNAALVLGLFRKQAGIDVVSKYRILIKKVINLIAMNQANQVKQLVGIFWDIYADSRKKKIDLIEESIHSHKYEFLLIAVEDPWFKEYCLNYVNRKGNNLLHLTIDYPEIVEKLLQLGCDRKKKNIMGDTPLNLANTINNFNSVSLLLKYGEKLNEQLRDKLNSYFLYIYDYGNKSVIEVLNHHEIYLLEKIIDCELIPFAISKNCFPLLEFVLQKEDISLFDQILIRSFLNSPEGYELYKKSLVKGKLDLAKKIMHHQTVHLSIEIDDIVEMLSLNCSQMKTAAFELLLSHPLIQNEENYNLFINKALENAFENKNLHMIFFILDLKNINIDFVNKEYEETAFHCAAYFEEKSLIIRKLISKVNENAIGEYLNKQDYKGNTILHLLSEWGIDPRLIKELVLLGARFDICNKENRYPFSIESNEYALLLQDFCSKTKKVHTSYPLSFFIIMDELTDPILEKFAQSIDMNDFHLKRTPIQLAIQYDYLHIIQQIFRLLPEYKRYVHLIIEQLEDNQAYSFIKQIGQLPDLDKLLLQSIKLQKFKTANYLFECGASINVSLLRETIPNDFSWIVPNKKKHTKTTGSSSN